MVSEVEITVFIKAVDILVALLGIQVGYILRLPTTLNLKADRTKARIFTIDTLYYCRYPVISNLT